MAAGSEDDSPQKKKRTRTLTTPHQSAVLHALLAKSRFPTTAMREEVGRQIGLSARKVQIWFQNQRQKARRPQSESGPLTRPPQFGPFPISTAGPSSSPYPSPSTAAPSSELSPSGASSAPSVGSPPPLSGPGVPSRRHSSAEPSRPSFGGDAFAPQPVETSPHFSRVLPPLNLSLQSRSGARPCVSATSPFPPPSSPNFVNTDHDSPATDPGGSLAIPPPFALQPQPQWDPLAFTPFTRPEFASWSHPRSSFSPAGVHDPSRARHFSGEPRRSGHSDPPLPRHISLPSRGERHSTSASSSRASALGPGHARSDDRGEA